MSSVRSFLVACALAVVLPGNTLAELGQLLDDDGRLVIEFGERQTGQDPKNATLVYIRSSH